MVVACSTATHIGGAMHGCGGSSTASTPALIPAMGEAVVGCYGFLLASIGGLGGWWRAVSFHGSESSKVSAAAASSSPAMWSLPGLGTGMGRERRLL